MVRARVVFMVPMIHRALPAIAVAILIGCGGKSGTATVKYSVSVSENYQRGLKQLSDKEWVAAAKYFSFIKARFPYSKFAVLAELRLADAEFGAGHYAQAIDNYKVFMKFHPTHEMVENGYAALRIGEAYFKQLPDDWWILPPSYEKDQSATSDAGVHLKRFLKKYSKSEFTPKAKKMLFKVNNRLARHEWYVANFYWKRGKPMGTVLRLRKLLNDYAGAGFDGDALWLLGRAYVRVKMPARARKAWSKLINQYPRHKLAGRAREALKRLTS